MKLYEIYKKEVVSKLQEQLKKKNIHAVPNLQKVTINVGLNSGLKDAKFLEAAEKTLQRISGQRPVKTRARKAISGFKIREGMVVGVKVTIRGKRMWDFVDKLVNVTLPRVRDFRGLSKDGFDEHGNYALGFREHLAFPEIRSDEIEMIHGLQVIITTNTKTKEEGKIILENLGFPFQKQTK